jgi:CBS domain-containing protein
MKIQEIMSSDVVTVSEDTPLKEVAEVLAERRISGLPVVDEDGYVVGVVSEADILFKERGPSSRTGVFGWLLDRYGFEGQLKLEARTAGEAMSAPALVIEPQRRVAEAAHLMLDRRVNRLPVIDQGRLVGIVTRADLVRAFVRGDAEIEREIREDVVLRTLWLEPTRVSIGVKGGHVTLHGDVETEANVGLLPSLVERVPGVVSVTSDLTWERGDR